MQLLEYINYKVEISCARARVINGHGFGRSPLIKDADIDLSRKKNMTHRPRCVLTVSSCEFDPFARRRTQR